MPPAEHASKRSKSMWCRKNFIEMIKCARGKQCTWFDLLNDLIRCRSSLYKRHLVVSTNAPSTYLHPPFDTNISFSFPLQPVKPDQYDTTTLPRPRRPRASSSPSTPQSHKLHRSNTCTSLSAKNVSADGSTTTITLGNLTYSLDSPFLDIRHFIRLIVHVSGQVRPICIGLPIKITAKVDESDLGILDADELPTYQSVACDEERLPDYTSGLDRSDTNADLNSARNSLEPCCWVREPLVVHDGRRDNSRRRRRTVEGGSGYTNPAAAVATAAENHTSNLDFIDLEELLGIPTATSPPPSTINHTACACTEHGCILAEERGLDDFGILQSHQWNFYYSAANTWPFWMERHGNVDNAPNTVLLCETFGC